MTNNTPKPPVFNGNEKATDDWKSIGSLAAQLVAKAAKKVAAE